MATFTQLSAELPKMILSGEHTAIELISAPGRGKSDWVTKELLPLLERMTGKTWGISVTMLATVTAPDLVGYLFKGEREYTDWQGVTHKVTITDPTMPTWLMSTEGKPLWCYERCIVFLDEYGQGEGDVKRGSAELFLNGRIGNWRIPKGSVVIAASNRMSDRSGVTKAFDFVINRRTEFHIADDVASWVAWANKANVHPYYVAFTERNPTVVFSEGVPEKQGPWCTPRSLVRACRTHVALSGDGKLRTDSFAIEALQGDIGTAAAMQVISFVKIGHDAPSYDDVRRDPTGTPVPETVDGQMLVCYECAARCDEASITPVLTYIQRLPKEFGVIFAKAVVSRHPKAILTPAFQSWTKANSSLVGIIQQR